MAKKELKLHAVVSQLPYLALGKKVADAFKTGAELKKHLLRSVK